MKGRESGRSVSISAKPYALLSKVTDLGLESIIRSVESELAVVAKTDFARRGCAASVDDGTLCAVNLDLKQQNALALLLEGPRSGCNGNLVTKLLAVGRQVNHLRGGDCICSSKKDIAVSR